MTTGVRVWFRLSNQERDILGLVVQDDTQVEIDQLLGLPSAAVVSRRVSGSYCEHGKRKTPVIGLAFLLLLSSHRGMGTRYTGTDRGTDFQSLGASSFFIDEWTELTLRHELAGRGLRLAVTNVLL